MIKRRQSEEIRLEGDELPPSPFAKFYGRSMLGGNPIDVYVLDTGDRVMSLRGAVKALIGLAPGAWPIISALKD